MKLVYFGAEWCGVCREKTPVVHQVASSLGLPLEVFDIDQHPGGAEAERLRIRTVPTLALVDGERVRFRLVGRLITSEQVRRLIEMTRRPAGS